MFAGRKTGRGVITQVKNEICRHGGTALALAHNGKIMLSSGPRSDYLKQIIPDFLGIKVANNTLRAQFQAAAFEATRIGDTKAGAFVFEDDRIYDHFFKAIYPFNFDKARDETYKVEAFISREFIKNSYGHVFTAICGADKKRVFYREELPTMTVDIPALIAALMKTNDIGDINGIPIDVIRRTYNAGGCDQAYRLICLGELRLMLHCAHRAELKGKEELARWFLTEYLERKELYLLERKNTWGSDKKGDRPIYNLSAIARHYRRAGKIQALTLRTLGKIKGGRVGIPSVPFPPMTLTAIKGQAVGLC